MIKWFKRNQDVSPKTTEPLQETTIPLEEPELIQQEDSEVGSLPEIEPSSESEGEGTTSKLGFYARFKQGLSKTRQQLGEGIGRILLGKKILDETIVEDLEALLLRADLGINTTQDILNKLSEGMARKQLIDGEAVFKALKDRLQAILINNTAPLSLQTEDKSPFVILMVGVNGAGKTTTIGKLAKQYQQQGKKVMLAAGDTFRAAAVQQLQVWGERNQIPVIAQHSGADSASVIYDALQAAKARGIDILIADTAGRLHTQNNLMEELKKVKRVMQKINPNAPHETMLILDASIGQNALNQAREFHQAVGLTGITMTKLDGTARGGILFAIANELAIPFRYIGIGEGIDDLRPFEATHFVKAIFNDD
ncbi:cell division membrane protein FtsY [Legionella beliardensis]|uniref:Signal recognition particle receptor FtsY n=1 Tax=Legionella beliardensis TaxID=91822 RepID=A0A378I556_9GAMM|nr:signal recognition particle-docking protein FtsY [Legionella beliardensis]STX29836.1 cell division membrane protein FtsY [Legionella beliardensis]